MVIVALTAVWPARGQIDWKIDGTEVVNPKYYKIRVSKEGKAFKNVDNGAEIGCATCQAADKVLSPSTVLEFELEDPNMPLVVFRLNMIHDDATTAPNACVGK